jgi:hypothetical protein
MHCNSHEIHKEIYVEQHSTNVCLTLVIWDELDVLTTLLVSSALETVSSGFSLPDIGN